MSSPRWIFGVHPVNECLRSQPQQVQRVMVSEKSSPRLCAVAETAKAAGISVHEVSRRSLTHNVGDVPHQGIIALLRPFPYATIEAMLQPRQRPPLLVALDQVQDPHNLGSLVRSAYALGAHGLIFPKNRACDVTAVATKAAAGATAHLPLARVTNLTRTLQQLKERGLWVMGTAPAALQPLHALDLTGPLVLVLGSEGSGMRRTVTKMCDFMGSIPMVGNLGSLNAAVAGALALYEIDRQRRAA